MKQIPSSVGASYMSTW